MIKIEKAGIDQSSLVFDLVEKLLMELREEGEEAGIPDRERARRHWLENSDKFTSFIARDENHKPIGIITLTECFAIYAGGNFGIINELYIIPEYRSQKVGQKLLETVKDYARKKGWKRIDVTAPPGDGWARTIRFYEREGFVLTGRNLKFFVD